MKEAFRTCDRGQEFIIIIFFSENLKERDHSEDLILDEMVVLKLLH
jgi:hypothetical protein